MPTPVPLKILSRRHQRNRLMIVLLVAIGTGAAARGVGPPVAGRIHFGALAGLIVMSTACFVVLLGLRRIAYGRAAAVFVIEAAALWLSFALGCLVVDRQIWQEAVGISLIGGASTVFVGLVALSLIQHYRPPRRLMKCPGCAYDLDELTSNVCPECGNRFTAACAACGCALHQMAAGTCPDCQAAFGPDTVLISPAGRSASGPAASR